MSGKAFIHRSSPSDVYETPYSLTQLLLDRERFDDVVLEPAAGRGAIVDVLLANGLDVVAYDEETDFLKEDRSFRYIVTNPPYSLADKFVRKAKELRPRKFAFFLRINYLSGQARLRGRIFEGLARIYVFSRMPDLRAPIRSDGKFPTAGVVYAWMVWASDHVGLPSIEWIDCGAFVLSAEEAREGSPGRGLPRSRILREHGTRGTKLKEDLDMEYTRRQARQIDRWRRRARRKGWPLPAWVTIYLGIVWAVLIALAIRWVFT